MANVTIVLGTGRNDRKSESVAAALKERFYVQPACTNVTMVDVKDHVTVSHTVPAWEASKEFSAWRDIAKNTDIFVFVLPEYNHGYPGEWKILIDSAYQEYAGKHAFVVGVSNGSFGGARVVDHVKPVLIELGLLVHKLSLYVGSVEQAFNEDGSIHDDTVRQRFDSFVQEVVQFAS